MEGKQSTVWGIQDLLGSSPSVFASSSAGGSTNAASAGGNSIVDATTHASATNILAKAELKEVTVLGEKSTFEVPIGVVINCLPRHEMTANGEAFCYTVLPKSATSTPFKIFEAGEDCEEVLRWKQEYPNYNASNLEKEGVLDMSNASYYFVHENHPAITLLRANKDLLRTDVDAQEKVLNEW